jgi:hypothetical protein
MNIHVFFNEYRFYTAYVLILGLDQCKMRQARTASSGFARDSMLDKELSYHQREPRTVTYVGFSENPFLGYRKVLDTGPDMYLNIHARTDPR